MYENKTSKIIILTPYELTELIENTLARVLSNDHLIRPGKQDLPELLNINQAAEFLSLAKQTLYGFTSKGVIPYLKRGKKLYFKKSQLDHWVAEGRASPF
jgi:excisionase family DNA binding protein